MKLSPEECRELVAAFENFPTIPYYLVQHAYLVAVLKRNGGNRSKTAREIKISLRSLRTKIHDMTLYGFEVEPSSIGTPVRKISIDNI